MSVGKPALRGISRRLYCYIRVGSGEGTGGCSMRHHLDVYDEDHCELSRASFLTVLRLVLWLCFVLHTIYWQLARQICKSWAIIS